MHDTVLCMPAALRERLAQLACRAYPREACGVLLGRRAGRRIEVVALFAARNRARAPARYDLHPADWLAADAAARRAGEDVIGVWHSHPDAEAIPSDSDRRAAWSEWSYLIVAVTAAGRIRCRSWRLANGEFHEEPIDP